MRLVLLLLCGCEGLSSFVSLGTNRPASEADGGARDVEAEPDAAPADAEIDASEPDATERQSDLVVSFLSDPPQAIEPGGQFDVEATVENRGTLGANQTTVRFDLSGVVLGESLIAAIEPGGSSSGRFRVTVPRSTSGPHPLRATADPQNVVAEVDEENNTTTAGRVLVNPLVVLPQSLDLSTPFGCVRSGALAIENRGNAAAAIALAIDGTSELTVSAPAPLVLPPGGTITATVTYAPIDRDMDEASLLISHDLGSTIEIGISGDGDDRPRTESFSQFAERRVDLLFVVDDSCSMGEEQDRLGERFAAFLDFAETETIDYHVAVTTTDPNDGGRFLGTPKVITPGTAAAAAAFAANAMVGVAGGEPEQGLWAAQQALSPALLEGDNAGFLRPEASLGIVYVSDEDDQSPGPLADYSAFLSALRPPPFLRANAIVGDIPSGCATAGAGTRYRALVDLIGGVSASICANDWDQTLIALAAGGFGFRTRFMLSGVPIEGTLEVHVNEVTLGDEFWDYVEGAIVFLPAAVPEAGSTIEVIYSPSCERIGG